MVEHLPCSCEALDSIPGSIKIEKITIILTAWYLPTYNRTFNSVPYTLRDPEHQKIVFSRTQ